MNVLVHRHGSADAEPSTTYTYAVDAAAGSGNHSPVAAPTVSATTLAGPAGDPVLGIAGDIACGPDDPSFNGGAGTATACGQKGTSDALFGSDLAAVLPLGDLQYTDGSLYKFQHSFDPTWGRLRSLMRPAVGNHEYLTPGASGYYNYFGAAAGNPAQGWYSYNIGAWHIVALNGECGQVGGCGAGSPQETWLRNDLAANPTSCTLAYWHDPRFSSGEHGSDATYSPFWRALYSAGVEVVLGGHDHHYERFAPQDPDGVATPNGIREFIVGTGGAERDPFVNLAPNREVFNNQTFGVQRLTLHPGGYDWQFVPTGGGTFTDSGSGTCHGPNPTG